MFTLQNIMQILRKHKPELEKKYPISGLGVFGSYARGEATAESDIDIAVIIKNVNDYFETRVELMKLRRNVNLYIEPHPIDEKDFKSHPLFNEITKAGLKISF